MLSRLAKIDNQKHICESIKIYLRCLEIKQLSQFKHIFIINMTFIKKNCDFITMYVPQLFYRGDRHLRWDARPL